MRLLATIILERYSTRLLSGLRSPQLYPNRATSDRYPILVFFMQRPSSLHSPSPQPNNPIAFTLTIFIQRTAST